MKLHTFLEYEKGRYKIIKKFLHFNGHNKPVEEKHKDDEKLLHSVNYFYFLTKDRDNTMDEVAYKYAQINKLHLIEGYRNIEDKVRFSDVSAISAVSDMDKTNEGFKGFLSNYMYAFIYPKKYQNYKIFKLDVLVSKKQAYYKLIDYSIDESRDEIIFSLNERVKQQIISN